MPPLYPQDALTALHRAVELRWLDVPLAIVEVACEPWALALIALALYSWLERDVKSVVETFVPLVVALAACAGLVLLARAAGGVARPAADGQAVAPLLRRAFPSGHASAAAGFATFSFLAYGRRATGAVVLAFAAAVARVVAGAHWALDLSAGGASGAFLAAATYALALRFFPDGHLAMLRAERRDALDSRANVA